MAWPGNPRAQTTGLVLLLTTCSILAGLVTAWSLAVYLVVVVIIMGFAIVRPESTVVWAIPAMLVATLVPAVTSLAIGGVAVLVAGVLIRRFRSLPLRAAAAVLVLAALFALSLVTSNYPTALSAASHRNHLLTTVLGLLLALAAMATRPAPQALIRSLTVAGLASSTFTLLNGDFVGGRLQTDALNSNSTGHVGALALVCAVAAASVLRNRLWLLVGLPSALLLFLSQSRGALLIVVVGLALPWVLKKLSAGRMLLVASMVAGLYLAWPVVASIIATLLSRRVQEESDTRVRVLETAWEAVQRHPIFGLGWRQFPAFAQEQIGHTLNTHNEYARVAAEAGLPALLLMLALLGFALRRSYRNAGHWGLTAVVFGGMTSLFFANVMSLLAVSGAMWLAVGACAVTAGRQPPAVSPDPSERDHPSGPTGPDDGPSEPPVDQVDSRRAGATYRMSNHT